MKQAINAHHITLHQLAIREAWARFMAIFFFDTWIIKYHSCSVSIWTIDRAEYLRESVKNVETQTICSVWEQLHARAHACTRTRRRCEIGSFGNWNACVGNRVWSFVDKTRSGRVTDAYRPHVSMGRQLSNFLRIVRRNNSRHWFDFQIFTFLHRFCIFLSLYDTVQLI